MFVLLGGGKIRNNWPNDGGVGENDLSKEDHYMAGQEWECEKENKVSRVF